MLSYIRCRNNAWCPTTTWDVPKHMLHTNESVLGTLPQQEWVENIPQCIKCALKITIKPPWTCIWRYCAWMFTNVCEIIVSISLYSCMVEGDHAVLHILRDEWSVLASYQRRVSWNPNGRQFLDIGEFQWLAGCLAVFARASFPCTCNINDSTSV